jgi:hypothetical protein
MPKAGIIGSGNILVTSKTDTNWPRVRKIAIYIKEMK